jgi:hypothetical protein
MAKGNRTTSPHRPPSHRATFDALDRIDNALTDIRGTFGVMSAVIDLSPDDDRESALTSVERHLAADLAALCAAFETAHQALPAARRRPVKGGAL